MGASANTVSVQRDWQERDFVQAVEMGVAQLAAFLNKFDLATRSKLSSLDGKLARLERRMELVEATLHSVDRGVEG